MTSHSGQGLLLLPGSHFSFAFIKQELQTGPCRTEQICTPNYRGPLGMIASHDEA